MIYIICYYTFLKGRYLFRENLLPQEPGRYFCMSPTDHRNYPISIGKNFTISIFFLKFNLKQYENPSSTKHVLEEIQN